LEDFYGDHPLESLVSASASGDFQRGLPKSSFLKREPEIVNIFRQMLVSGCIDTLDGDAPPAALRTCHRRGWLHAELVRDQQDDIIRYTFASYLHACYVSWRLSPPLEYHQYASILELVIHALSHFKPSQLLIPIQRAGRQLGSTPPEAQYQDEFYRALHDATSGRVCISPEFASGRRARVAGRIDFYLQSEKWGIEITRNGSLLDQHDARFQRDGAYGAWLKSGAMSDYVLLDCRENVPCESHPSAEFRFLLDLG
jgi:hypothetical protein